MKKFKAAAWILLIVPFVFLWSCGGGGGSAGSSTSDGSGTLSLSLVDAPVGSYKAVYVTIGEVQVCMEAGTCDNQGEGDDCECQWETVDTLNQTFNLLELVNGVTASLGQKDLAAGTYHQMRLLLHDVQDLSDNILGNAHPYPQYLIDEDDEEHEMKVPSGYQTGIKLVHPFDIDSGLTTELILDFDVARSVVKAGNSGKYLLKPTIKVIGTYNRAIVSGIVTTTDGEPPAPLEGAIVTAWYQDADDNWVAAASAGTDVDGGYMLYLNLYIGNDLEPVPTEYKLVATAQGYEPACTSLIVEAGQTYADTDFALSATATDTVTGTITGKAPAPYPDSGNAPVVIVSFNRQVGECVMDPIETAFVIVSAGDANVYNSDDGTFSYTYTIDLPAGVYNVIASSEGLASVAEDNFDTRAGVLNFIFTAP